jgi:hypothetical protein
MDKLKEDVRKSYIKKRSPSKKDLKTRNEDSENKLKESKFKF